MRKILLVIIAILVLGVIVFFVQKNREAQTLNEKESDTNFEQFFDDYPADDTDTGTLPQ